MRKRLSLSLSLSPTSTRDLFSLAAGRHALRRFRLGGRKRRGGGRVLSSHAVAVAAAECRAADGPADVVPVLASWWGLTN